MGKGDRKTKRGKIIKGTFGARRSKKNRNMRSAVQNTGAEKKPVKKKTKNK